MPFKINFKSKYQLSSVVSDSLRPHGAAHQASLSITNSWSLLKLMSIESVMPSNHLILHTLVKILSGDYQSMVPEQQHHHHLETFYRGESSLLLQIW